MDMEAGGQVRSQRWRGNEGEGSPWHGAGILLEVEAAGMAELR
jgi:hypothetical protein